MIYEKYVVYLFVLRTSYIVLHFYVPHCHYLFYHS